MSFRAFAMIVLGVLFASAVTILIASQIAISTNGSGSIGLGLVLLTGLIASVILRLRGR